MLGCSVPPPLLSLFSSCARSSYALTLSILVSSCAAVIMTIRHALPVLVLLATAGAESTARLNGDALDVGDTAFVRLNVTGEPVVVGFIMCGPNNCSKVEAWGIGDDSLTYTTFVGCGTNGYGGVMVHGVGSPSLRERAFPASSVWAVSRRSEQELAVWLHDKPGTAVAVNLSADQSSLHVMEHKDDAFSPGDATIEFLQGGICLNGGRHDWKTNSCQCPPGFDGESCQTGCGPGRYGRNCSKVCWGSPASCRGIFFELACPSDRSGRCAICAAGLHGPLCDKICADGMYGAGCLQHCGHCADTDGGGTCDPYTGHCHSGCRTGHHGPTCHLELTHLRTGPNITSVSARSFSGNFLTTPEHMAGSGQVVYYEVQYQEEHTGKWTSGSVGRLDGRANASAAPPAALPTEHHFHEEGLRPRTPFRVRVLLMDDKLRTFTAVPHVRIVTENATQWVSNIEVASLTSRNAAIKWTPILPGLTFSVIHECLRLLACSAECTSMSGIQSIAAAEGNVTLSGLLPGAEYRLHLQPEGVDWVADVETVSFTTPFTVPDVAPMVEGVAGITDNSATIRWSAPDSCAQLNGLLVGVEWQLYLRGPACPGSCPVPGPFSRGTSRSPAVKLRYLYPNTAYELRMHLVNTEGGNPEKQISVPFTTANYGDSSSDLP